MKYSSYILGVFTGLAVSVLYSMIHIVIEAPETPQKPQTTFEVIANYDGCDIVKMEKSNFYEPQYFMRCPK
jgi:hypothetical protein